MSASNHIDLEVNLNALTPIAELFAAYGWVLVAWDVLKHTYMAHFVHRCALHDPSWFTSEAYRLGTPKEQMELL